MDRDVALGCEDRIGGRPPKSVFDVPVPRLSKRRIPATYFVDIWLFKEAT